MTPVNFARDPLHSYFNEPQKNEIHPLYLLFVFRSFVFIICDVMIKSLQISGEEKLQTDMFGYYVQQPSPWNVVSWMLRQPVNYCIYLWRRLQVTSREQVMFIDVWISSVQKRFI